MPLTESNRGKSRILTTLAGYTVIPSVGLACYRLSAWIMFRSEIGSIDLNFSFVSHCIQAIAIILLLIIDKRILYDETKMLRAAGLATAFIVVGTLFLLIDSSDMILIYISGALCGAAGAVTLLGWGYYFCSVDPKKSAFGLTFAFALYGLATWGLSAVPAHMISFLVVLCPLISYICLYMSIARNSENVLADAPVTKEVFSSLPWGMLALLLICTIISILAKILVPATNILLSSAYRIYWPILFTCIFLLFCVWIFVLKRDDQNRLWPVFILIVFSGLLCYSSFSTTHPEFASSFFRATQECLMLFCWIEICSLTYYQKLPRVATFGLSTLLFLKPPTIVATLMSTFSPIASLNQSKLPAVITTAAMAFILMVLTIILVGQKPPGQTRKSLKDTKEESTKDASYFKIEGLLEEYDLTQRECEVAYYLSKGYTLQQMADILCLSLNTIRSHTKRLYRKLGIHKKQELIALIEQKEA